jgi:hypothetical protein
MWGWEGLYGRPRGWGVTVRSSSRVKGVTRECSCSDNSFRDVSISSLV